MGPAILDPETFVGFLATIHPYDSFGLDETKRVAGLFQPQDVKAGGTVYTAGKPLVGLYLIESGRISVTDPTGAPISTLTRGNSFGERGLLRDGAAATTAVADEKSRLWCLPAAEFRRLMADQPDFRRFFERGANRKAVTRPNDLTSIRVADLMTRTPLTCTPDTPAVDAARQMREAWVSSLCVTGPNGVLIGIVTVRDLSGRVLAEGLSGETPVSEVMTTDPLTLPPDAIGSDVLNLMMERRIGHVPVTDDGRLTGIVTQTDLTHRQALTSAYLVGDIARAEDAGEIAVVTARIPSLLQQLVAGGNRHDVVTRLITDIADAATRRLLSLAEQRHGSPPVPYLWLACGSQGRREQTGVSDQDNCLILDDTATKEDFDYFDKLARFVSDGLNTAGYVYCPGDMMATASRWRQPLKVWREYFRGWIATPNPEAQMLASVMFDLRPIGGAGTEMFSTLQAETLASASKNSIFVAHMVGNSLKHRPPLGMLRGLATLRSGEHRNTIDMKANGVVPIVDLARLYALMAALQPANTRARITSAAGTHAVSESGARDLLDAYDVIASARLAHQGRQIAKRERPNNFLPPGDLSEFDRSHLRDAFVVVRTMQSAVGQGRGTVL